MEKQVIHENDKRMSYSEEQIFQASYPDPPQLLVSKIPIARLDTTIGRAYYKRNVDIANRIYIYSSTTIISNTLSKGIGFNMWLGNATSYKDAMEYANERAYIGTMTHAMIMYLIWGETVNTDYGFFNDETGKIDPIPNEVKKRLQGFLDFYDEYQPTPVATEISLYAIDKDEDGDLYYDFAGTADQVLNINGKLWLIDIKTGKEYPKDHQLQLTSYKILWDHIYGPEYGKIDVMACLYLTSRGKYKVKKYKYAPFNWYNVIENFEFMVKDGRGKMPVIREKEELPTIYRIGEDKDDGTETEV